MCEDGRRVWRAKYYRILALISWVNLAHPNSIYVYLHLSLFG